jgi:hypothetical protein
MTVRNATSSKDIQRRRSRGFISLVILGFTAGGGLEAVAGRWAASSIVTSALVQIVLVLAWLLAADRQTDREARLVRQVLRDFEHQPAANRIRIRTDAFHVVVEHDGVSPVEDDPPGANRRGWGRRRISQNPDGSKGRVLTDRPPKIGLGAASRGRVTAGYFRDR